MHSNEDELSISWLTVSRGRVALLVFVVLAAVYLSTASWDLPVNTDALTNSVTAERIASTGSPVVGSSFEPLTQPPLYGHLGWFVETPRGIASKYPPGAPLVGAIAYLVAPNDEPQVTDLVRFIDDGGTMTASVPMPPIWPATVAAAVTAAAASAMLVPVLSPQMSLSRAGAAALVMGLGTSAWSVAADSLWQHSVTIAAITGSGLLASRHRSLGSGLVLGFAVLTRPLTAFIAAVQGVLTGWWERRLWPMVGLGLGSMGGLAALLAYNRWLFGSWSPLGGYGSEVGTAGGDVMWVGVNIVEGLFGWRVGVLVWSPFVLVGLFGALKVWRSVPVWARAAAVGGAVYLLAQFALNRADPDAGVYRYPLEALFSAAPLLSFGLSYVWDRGGRARWVTALAVGVGVAAQALAAFVTPAP